MVVAIVGILAGMALPAWNQALGKWQVSDAQQQVASAIRNTQVKAQSSSANWQFSIYETTSGEVQWSSHPQTGMPTNWTRVGNSAIDIDLADTTLDSKSGAYYIRFDYKGNLASRTRTLTLTHRSFPGIKRCLIMSTILGKMRLATEQENPSSAGRYCH
ncbi:type II secretion system protein [Leptothoe kymatousa TAU-MAC 1615]|uniref:Type II secretion system protein n=2 Tax=Leptothoe TaxID=2651725 RepID=A0ABS5Y143_9CYAN|nr:type II secretion system protein [Leptothoe kymatousa TAU-MAC 1615]